MSSEIDLVGPTGQFFILPNKTPKPERGSQATHLGPERGSIDVPVVGVQGGGVPRVRNLGRYELFAKLGSGGMAEVHLARQRGLKRFRKLVVVKTVHPQLARDERFVDLLLDEARISALLKHPRVVDIYDVDEDEGVVFIAMEYLPGQSVTALIKAARRGNQLDVFSCARIVANAAEGLEAAHNLRTHSGEPLELVHRDVSPGNIVVLYRGDVKLVDFGVAKARDHLSSSAIGKFAGKLGYAPPEQLGSENADRRSDVFSLGVVFWELLCNRRLFSAKSRDEALKLVGSGKAPKPSSIRTETPEGLDAICLKALQPRPTDRYQTAREMGEAIEAVLVEADYPRQNELIATYMDEVFEDERFETEALVRRISESTNQISIAQLESEDAATTIDDSLPEKIAAAESASDMVAIGPLAAAAIGTAPGAPRLSTRMTAVFRSGHPMRRPVIYCLSSVAAILLLFVLFEFATTGTSTPGAMPSNAKAAAGLVADAPLSLDETDKRDAAKDAAALGESDAAPQLSVVPSARLLDAAVTGAPEPPKPPKPAEPTSPEPDKTHTGDASSDKKKKKKAKKKAKKKKNERRESDDPKLESKDEPPPERDRKSAQANYREGLRALRSGNMSLAREKLKAALAADPGYSVAHRGLGVAHQASGNKSSAVRAFRRYLRANPSASDADRIRKRIESLQGAQP